MKKFADKFDSYVCVGDMIETEVDGYTVRAHVEHDSYTGIDETDCWNPDQSVTGCNDEQQAELLAARKAWRNDEWFFCGIVLSVYRGGVKLLDNANALWGIECNYPGSDNSYLATVANELLEEAMDAGRLARVEMIKAIS